MYAYSILWRAHWAEYTWSLHRAPVCDHHKDPAVLLLPCLLETHQPCIFITIVVVTCQLLLGKLLQRKLSLYETYRLLLLSLMYHRKENKGSIWGESYCSGPIKVTISVKCRWSLLSQLRRFKRGRKGGTGGYRGRGREASFTLGEMWVVWARWDSGAVIFLFFNSPVVLQHITCWSTLPIVLRLTRHRCRDQWSISMPTECARVCVLQKRRTSSHFTFSDTRE